MEMRDRLAGVGSAVGHDAEAVGQPFGGGNLRDDREDVGNQRGVVSGNVGGGREVRLGNNQDMHGRHGIYIPEGVYRVVLVHLGRGYLTGDNAAEKAIVHRKNPPRILLLSYIVHAKPHSVKRGKRNVRATAFTFLQKHGTIQSAEVSGSF